MGARPRRRLIPTIGRSGAREARRKHGRPCGDRGKPLFLGLVWPRFLLRLPYGKGTDPISAFDYEEMPPDPQHDGYLWGNPALLCACMLGQAFGQTGKCLLGVECQRSVGSGGHEQAPPFGALHGRPERLGNSDPELLVNRTAEGAGKKHVSPQFPTMPH